EAARAGTWVAGRGRRLGEEFGRVGLPERPRPERPPCFGPRPQPTLYIPYTGRSRPVTAVRMKNPTLRKRGCWWGANGAFGPGLSGVKGGPPTLPRGGCHAGALVAVDGRCEL